MRFRRSILLTFSALLCAARTAAAEVPPDLGRSETRCDDSGCMLGACVARDMWTDPLFIIGKARILPHTADGKVSGFKLFAIRPGSFLQKLGLQNGDTIQSVNGLTLDNPTAALSAYEGLRGKEVITLQLERHGQPLQRILRLHRRPISAAECPALPPPEPSPPVAAPTQNAPPSAPAAEDALRDLNQDIVCTELRCKLKHGVLDRILDRQDLLLSSARIVPAIKDGKSIGMKLFAIRPGSLFHRLLLRNGDVVRTVGGVEMNSPEKALQVYASLRKATTIPMAIERAGQSVTLIYQIEK